MLRLRRSNPNAPGIRRRRRGNGFSYVDTAGNVVSGGPDRDRIKSLVIPPAWREVWICTDPLGHIQATGVDDAGRRQYLYHPDWRVERDAAKHQRVLGLATALPEARTKVATDLLLDGPVIERTLAAAFRLLDVGFFRVGSEQYAQRHGTFGLATLLRADVTTSGDAVRFAFLGKHSIPVNRRIIDRDLARVVRSLLRRRDSNPELLAWRDGKRWVDVRSNDINAYVQSATGANYTAKDFRTWHGTVLAAAALAVSQGASDDPKARQRAVRRAVVEVASYLGNTPAVARGSYIDPRVIEHFERGRTIPVEALDAAPPGSGLLTHGPAEQATLQLLQRRIGRHRRDGD